MRANYSQGAPRQAQNHDRKRGASRHAAKGTAMAARRGKGDPAACPGSLVHMSNYLVTYLPTDPPTHHTYLPPYFLTYFPRRRRSLNKTLTFLYKDDCAPNNCCTSESLGRTRPESCALSPRAIHGPHIITFCRTSTASSYTCCALSSFFCFLRLSAIPSFFSFLRPLFLSDFSFCLC